MGSVGPSEGVGDCVQSPRLLALITSLSALMLQVRMDGYSADGVGNYGVADCIQSPGLLALITSLSALMVQVCLVILHGVIGDGDGDALQILLLDEKF